MKKKLAIDHDDVVMGFNAALCCYHNARYGTTLTRADITSYHLKDIWDTTTEEAHRRIFDFYCSKEHEEAEPMPGAKKVIEMLEEHYEIEVITARPERFRPQTLAWLEGHFPQLVDRVHFTNRFGDTGKEILKSEVCARIDAEIFVDDAPMHHEDVARVVPRTILFEAPWNREYAATLPQKQRVRSWYGLAMRLA